MAVSAIGDLRDEHGWTREGSRGLIVFKTISKGKGLTAQHGHNEGIYRLVRVTDCVSEHLKFTD